MENDVKEVPVSEEQTVVEEVTETTPVKPGEKTDPALLLESLKEEREKRRLAEEEKKRIEAELLAYKTQPEIETFSDEGKLILSKVSELEGFIKSQKEKEILQELESTYPQLKDKKVEFELYRQDNPGMKLETQAKAFLVENELLDTPKVRKGLEKSSGGGRVPPQTGISAEQIDKLRMENPRKFRDMLKSGQIKL